ncbi:hypothetical protein, partial [Pseudomonas savastanoi]|uniref:hypothetical protein n=1 Tax=Pseudomonas savastanoi TaxID=29438 RepID=UPI001C826FEA
KGVPAPCAGSSLLNGTTFSSFGITPPDRKQPEPHHKRGLLPSHCEATRLALQNVKVMTSITSRIIFQNLSSTPVTLLWLSLEL